MAAEAAGRLGETTAGKKSDFLLTGYSFLSLQPNDDLRWRLCVHLLSPSQKSLDPPLLFLPSTSLSPHPLRSLSSDIILSLSSLFHTDGQTDR